MEKLYENAFKVLNLLEEEDFELDAIEDNELKDFLDDEEEETVDIIDPMAEDEEDVKDSYMDKVVLECSVCHSLIYKDPSEVVEDDESEDDLVNSGEECPYCMSTDGYKIVGQIAPYETTDVTVEVEPKDDEEGEVEEVTESFRRKKARKNLTESSYNKYDEIPTNDELVELAKSLGFEDEDDEDSPWFMNGDEFALQLYSKNISKLMRAMKRRWHKFNGKVYDDGSPMFVDDDGTFLFQIVNESLNESLMSVNQVKAATKVSDLDWTAPEWDNDDGSVEDLSDWAEDCYNKIVSHLNKIPDIANGYGWTNLDVDTDWAGFVDKIAMRIMKCIYFHYFCESDYDSSAELAELKLNESLKEDFWNPSREFKDFINYLNSNVDYDDWNSLSAKERIDLVTPAIKDYVRKNSYGVVWQLLLSDLADNNYHTEYKVLLRALQEDKIDESLENIDIETEHDKIHVEAEEKTDEEEEMIVPVEPEVRAEIADNSEVVEEEPEEEDVDIEEFDEESFNELGESFLKKNYSNVTSFKTTKIMDDGNNLFVEGLITFNSGSKKNTSFKFTPSTIRNNKVKFFGENLQINNGKKAFKLNGRLDNNKLIAESLTYNYIAKNQKNESKRISGTVSLKEAKVGKDLSKKEGSMSNIIEKNLNKINASASKDELLNNLTSIFKDNGLDTEASKRLLLNVKKSKSLTAALSTVYNSYLAGSNLAVDRK